MIDTTVYPRLIEPHLVEALADSPAVLIHGPRQCGKTTLARIVGASRGYRYVTFDDEVARSAAQDDPLGFAVSDTLRATNGLLYFGQYTSWYSEDLLGRYPVRVRLAASSISSGMSSTASSSRMTGSTPVRSTSGDVTPTREARVEFPRSSVTTALLTLTAMWGRSRGAWH